MATTWQYPTNISPTAENVTLHGETTAVMRVWKLSGAAGVPGIDIPELATTIYTNNGLRVHTTLLIACDDGGDVLAVYRRDDTDKPWQLVTATKKPALQIVFQDERGRAAMLHYLNAVKNGVAVNPSLAVVLDRLAQPITAIDV